MLGALAVAEPSSAASMLKDMTFKLSAATQRLAAAKSSASSDPAAADRGAIPEALRRSMNNVNGYALGLAALLGASTRWHRRTEQFGSRSFCCLQMLES